MHLIRALGAKGAKHRELLANLTKFAESAQKPIRPGEIYDRTLMDNDHNNTKPKMEKETREIRAPVPE